MQRINDEKTALLIMDVYQLTVPKFKDAERYLISLSGALNRARISKMPVIYVIARFRNGFPEVSPENKMFMSVKENNSLKFDTVEGTVIHSAVAPLKEDIIVIKKRISAFTGSDLEVVLRSAGITHIVLAGISSSGVVLSTLCEAADKDFKISVLSDCCTDMDEEVHNTLVNKIFPRQANVTTSDKWAFK